MNHIKWIDFNPNNYEEYKASFPCNHNYIQKDAYWKSCTHCGACAPFIREAF